MTDRLNDIQKAINTFQMDEARRLLREELQENPSADTYYLASQAARTHGQRMQFLEKALDIDPFHQAAHDELASILPPDMDASPASVPTRKTKEKATPAYPLASNGKRVLAFLIDNFILVLIGLALGGIYGMFAGATMPINGTEAELTQAMLQIQMTAMMLGIIVNAIYHVFFMTRMNGQTPGKQLVGIRVVKKDGKPFTIGDAILRNVIGYWVSQIALYIGYIWAFFDKESQGWHDKIAGTVVVEDR